MKVNGESISSNVADPVWPGPDIDSTELPERLVEMTVEDWRSHRWDFEDKRTGVYPDAASLFGNDTAAWSGFVVVKGRAFRYRSVWYRSRENVSVTLTRRGRQVASFRIPLGYYFPRPEECELQAGKTTVAHIEDHIDPAAQVRISRMEMEWADRNLVEHGDDFDAWEPPTADDLLADEEVRDGCQMLLQYSRMAVDAAGPDTSAEEAEFEERAAVVPSDGQGVTYDELKSLWDVGDKQATRIALRLVELKRLRSEDRPSPRGGRPRKVFWRVDSPATEEADG